MNFKKDKDRAWPALNRRNTDVKAPGAFLSLVMHLNCTWGFKVSWRLIRRSAATKREPPTSYRSQPVYMGVNLTSTSHLEKCMCHSTKHQLFTNPESRNSCRTLDKTMRADGAITLATKIVRDAPAMKRAKGTENRTLPPPYVLSNTPVGQIQEAADLATTPPDLLKLAKMAQVY
ncbi:hypothetical protein HAX54_027961 [Datura stramonium]|uniref:Uncharacterized protein n=1 Tax=Datura stramonium TaxID=4076 RepID=A0ABS8V4V0_DATST|nr:hypothetical protein [Datura stramonium]